MKNLSLVSRLGFGSDSSFTSGQSNSTKDFTTIKDTAMDFGMVTGNLSSIPEVKKMIVQTALNKLFNDEFFSICTLNKIIDLIEVSDKSEAYKQLSALHCVHYKDMSKDLRQIFPRLVNEALKIETVNIATQSALEGVVF